MKSGEAQNAKKIVPHDLKLGRCPVCGVSDPTLRQCATATVEDPHRDYRLWVVFGCGSCAGVVVGEYLSNGILVAETIMPKVGGIDEAVPERPRDYLVQATETLHAPAGSQMLSASAVDAMLKEKGYADGVLNTRIKKAAEDHLITPEMEKWAHQVRLEANYQRHADQNAPLPTEEEARQTLEFAKALAEFLFVLPSRVTRGLTSSSS